MSLIEQGGNQKLFEFFEKFDLNKEEIPLKYNSNAAVWYRKKLAAIAFGQPNSFTESEPSKEEGRKQSEGSLIN